MAQFDPSKHDRNRRGEFTQMSREDAGQLDLVNRFEDMTPADIDTELAAVHAREYAAYMAVDARQRWVESAERAVEHAGKPGTQWRHRTREDAEAELSRCQDELASARAAWLAVREETKPFDEEFERRGGWTRAYLATHVHSSTACHTLYPTTKITWLPQYSGADEDAIVADAGEKACTVCYPDAPVEVRGRPSVIEDPEKAAARAERQRRAAEKAAKAAASGITTPDGQPLVGRWGVIKTERTAQTEAVDALMYALSYEKNAVNPPEGMVTDPEHYRGVAATYRAQLAAIVPALAHKRGLTVDEVSADLEKRARAKAKRLSWDL